MASEIARFYPESGSRVPVVRLAPFVLNTGAKRTSSKLASQISEKGPYLLCPTQMTIHKNVGSLIAAQALLREKYPNLRLVLTGLGSDWATGRASPIGTIRDHSQPDVIGLGYVTNDEIDALIDRAAAVVNPSFYEAGNGSGIDAWSRGIPVAMSDIPSFREHLEFQGVEAAMFDPRNPEDIASKIEEILNRPEEWAETARRSQAAMSLRTWDDVAEDYLSMFDAAHASARS
jgi:glycosyltransferase involved in cell wall biosynthesis